MLAKAPPCMVPLFWECPPPWALLCIKHSYWTFWIWKVPPLSRGTFFMVIRCPLSTRLFFNLVFSLFSSFYFWCRMLVSIRISYSFCFSKLFIHFCSFFFFFLGRVPMVRTSFLSFLCVLFGFSLRYTDEWKKVLSKCSSEGTLLSWSSFYKFRKFSCKIMFHTHYAT